MHSFMENYTLNDIHCIQLYTETFASLLIRLRNKQTNVAVETEN